MLPAEIDHAAEDPDGDPGELLIGQRVEAQRAPGFETLAGGGRVRIAGVGVLDLGIDPGAAGDRLVTGIRTVRVGLAGSGSTKASSTSPVVRWNDQTCTGSGPARSQAPAPSVLRMKSRRCAHQVYDSSASCSSATSSAIRFSNPSPCSFENGRLFGSAQTRSSRSAAPAARPPMRTAETAKRREPQPSHCVGRSCRGRGEHVEHAAGRGVLGQILQGHVPVALGADQHLALPQSSSGRGCRSQRSASALVSLRHFGAFRARSGFGAGSGNDPRAPPSQWSSWRRPGSLRETMGGACAPWVRAPVRCQLEMGGGSGRLR